MVKRTLTLVTVLLLTLTMTMGCTRVQKGAALGAAGGAVIGGIWASHGGNILSAGEGAAVGAATGGLVGALLGDADAKSEAWHDLGDDINERDAQIAGLQKENGQMKTKLQACDSDLDACNRRVTQQDKQIADLKSELAKCKGARVEMTLLADVLFVPGSARLSATGRKALDDAAERIGDLVGDEFVTVQGHTDTDLLQQPTGQEELQG